MAEIEVTSVGSDEREFTKLTVGEFLTPMRGRGKELCDLLRKELRVPEGARSFEVKFHFDDVIRVTCDYMPKQEGG